MKRLLHICVLICCISFNLNAQISISSKSSTNETCFGLNDGTITITIVDNGIPTKPPYVFELRESLTLNLVRSQVSASLTSLFTGVAPGLYIIRVRDNNTPINYTFSSDILIDQAAVLSPGTIAGDQNICAGVDPVAFTSSLKLQSSSSIAAT